MMVQVCNPSDLEGCGRGVSASRLSSDPQQLSKVLFQNKILKWLGVGSVVKHSWVQSLVPKNNNNKYIYLYIDR